MLAGAFLGAFLRNVLPGHHLEADAKDVVRLGTGLIGTIAALVLGLLISSANNTYNTEGGQVQQLTSDIVLLDNLLEQYGPETRVARELVRRAVSPLVQRIWHENNPGSARSAPFVATASGERAYAEIQALSPRNDNQHSLKDKALEVATDLVRARLQLFQHADQPIPMPFLAVLVLWLAVIFASFSLFTRLNTTLIVIFIVFALSASAAIFLILELSQPFAGLMQISSAPLSDALAPLKPQGSDR